MNPSGRIGSNKGNSNQYKIGLICPVKSTRGVSADTNRINHKAKGQLSFNKLVAQTNMQTEVENRHNCKLMNEKVHSLSPSRSMEPENKFLLPPQTASNVGKKTLILDLDETLIHSDFQTPKCEADIVLKIEIEKNINNIYVLKRAGVDEFLTRMADLYEIVIFTASMSKYADPLMDILDKQRVCHFRLFRESCTLLNGFYVKELKRLNRNMKNVILLDNNPASYYLDVENGLPIKSFYDDKTDIELMRMTSVLEDLAKVNDVRDYIKEIIYMNQINYETAKEIFTKINEDSRITGRENIRYDLYNFKPNNKINIQAQEKIASKKLNNIEVKKKEDIKNKLKIIKVEVFKNRDESQSKKLQNSIHALNRMNRSVQSNLSMKKSSDNSIDKVNKSSSNFHKQNVAKNSINLKILKRNDSLKKEYSVTTTKVSKINKVIKRTASDNSITSKQIIFKSNTSDNNLKPSKSTAKRINSLPNSTRSVNNLRKSSTLTSSANIITFNKSNTLTNKSVAITSSQNSKTLKGISDFQNNLKNEAKNNLEGNSTGRMFNPNGALFKKKISLPTKENLTEESKNNSKDKFIPSSVRNASNFLNFRKDPKESSSVEKYNSIFTNKTDINIKPLSESQHSSSSSNNKLKSDSFNSLAYRKAPLHSDLKILKIVSNKSLSKSNNFSLKDKTKK